MEKIRFYSTNAQAPKVGLKEALLQGQAPDRGACHGSADPEHPAVEAEPPPVVRRAGEHVRIVRHNGHRGPFGVRALRRGEADSGAVVLAGAHLTNHRGDRLLLVVPVLIAMHRLGVDPEADVVEERSVTREAVVDQQLLTVADGVERGQRVVPIEPEVEGEVVPCPDRDAEKRHIPIAVRPLANPNP